MKKLLLLLVSIVSTISFGQVITTTNLLTPEELVNNILVGSGVTVSNVTYNGSAVNAQNVQTTALSFTATGFPFASGMYLRTSTGIDISDPDLDAISTNTITNGAILEFDFVPSGDSLVFNYMFASAEYPQYVCSGFNDVFGFFISGPGISGPFTNGAENIALVPGTNVPVAINTVNSGTAGGSGNPATCAAQDPNWQANSVYYTTLYANYSGEGYNGGTISLPALAQLQCGLTYHIKLAIANVGDYALNSGVYLEGGSFNSDAVQVAIATVSGDTTVVEACTTADLLFIRPQSQVGDTMIINYTVTGTATEGTDYNFLANPVTFLPGEDTITLTIDPYGDGIPDNNESVIITATTINQCGDTVISTGTIWIVDTVLIDITAADPTVACENDSVMVVASASGGTNPYTYNWSNGQVGDTAYLSTIISASSGDSSYVLTVMDVCGYSSTDTIVISLDPIIIDSIVTGPQINCSYTGSAEIYLSGNISSPSYSWTGPGNPGTYNSSTSDINNIPQGVYYITVTDGICIITDSAYVDSIYIENLSYDLPDTLVVFCPGDSALAEFSNMIGATIPVTYNWSNGDTTSGSYLVGSELEHDTLMFYVDIEDGCGFAGSDSVMLIVNKLLNIDSLISTPTSGCVADGSVSAYVSGITSALGDPFYHWGNQENWDTLNVTGDYFSDGIYDSTTVWEDLGSGWYFFTVTDDVCIDQDSVFVEMLNPPQAILTVSPGAGCSPVNVTFENNSVNTDSYYWDFGNGNTLNINDQSSQYQAYYNDAYIMLVASAGPCSDTAFASVSVIVCGCTDPIANNYDPNAAQDDGSCIYPVPAVVAPNVFTPNGDGDNDIFYLTTTNAVNLEFVILNRWGNTMYEESSDPSLGIITGWDGRTRAGAKAENGTYFYKYIATGVNGDIVEGHGFLQLVNE